MICDVYQVGDNPDHLLLVLGEEVINGAWNIKSAEHYGIKVSLLGQIDWFWESEYKYESYNDVLYRFQKGERAVPPEKCPCCGRIK